MQSSVFQLVVQLAVAQCNLSRLQLSLDGSRLGSVGLARNGALGFAEVCAGRRQSAARVTQRTCSNSRTSIRAAASPSNNLPAASCRSLLSSC